MRMYPAYKLRDVLDEYAITFFTLLAEGYRYQYRHYYNLVNVFSVPYMEDDDRKEFIRNLEWATQEPSDILKPSDDYSGIEDLKRML